MSLLPGQLTKLVQVGVQIIVEIRSPEALVALSFFEFAFFWQLPTQLLELVCSCGDHECQALQGVYETALLHAT